MRNAVTIILKYHNIVKSLLFFEYNATFISSGHTPCSFWLFAYYLFDDDDNYSSNY